MLQEKDVLFWRHESGDENEWHDLEPAPATNSGFDERHCYLFKQPSAGWSLYIDDELLQYVSRQSDIWEWKPGFFAGEVTAELKRPDGSSAGLFLLDVGPDPGKVGREVFEGMLRELWAEDPTLVIGEEPATTAIGELGTLQDPWVAFARLRRYMPDFFRAIAGIRRAPRRTLRLRRESAPLYHVRRVDSRTALSVLRSSAVSLFMEHPEHTHTISLESCVDVPAIEETVDAAANRAILALLRALLRRALAVLERLEAEVNREKISDTRTPLASRWPVRRAFLQRLIMTLGSTLRRFPFTEVQRSEVTAAGLTAIAADPTYSRAWSRGWRALRTGIESDIGTERLWVSPSWEIYERWCFLRLGQLLASTMPTWQWSLSRNPRCWTGIGNDVQAKLRLQPTFPSRSSEKHGKWSISKKRVPDLVLTIEGGFETRFIVLDAKYRKSRGAVLDAMESAHIYQDSLRIGRRRPEATLLLVPSIGEVAHLAAQHFVAEHRVGIFSLLPGESAPLPEVITAFFRLGQPD